MKRARQDAPSALAPWLLWVGHSGYIAEGVVYVLIGAFALLSALESSQQPNGYNGALAKLAAAPFGDAMLALLALGLAAFVQWQVMLAILDPEHWRDRRTVKRRAVRLGYLLNGALHGILVGEAVWRLLGFGGAADDGHSQAVWTARAMALAARPLDGRRNGRRHCTIRGIPVVPRRIAK